MIRRLALVFLVALAACGSSTSHPRDAGTLHVELSHRPDPLRAGPVHWTVAVVNGTDRSVDLTFPTGQRADVTLSRGEDVAYQWSRGMLFTQLVGHVTIPAGGTRTFDLDGNLDASPGTYRLDAVVTSSDHMDLGVSREVTVRSR